MTQEAAHAADVNCVQWNPKAQGGSKWMLATAGDDNLIKVWELGANESA